MVVIIYEIANYLCNCLSNNTLHFLRVRQLGLPYEIAPVFFSLNVAIVGLQSRCFYIGVEDRDVSTGGV